MKCWNCGFPINDEDAFCPTCGSRQNQPVKQGVEIKNEKKRKKSMIPVVILLVTVSFLVLGGSLILLFYKKSNLSDQQSDTQVVSDNTEQEVIKIDTDDNISDEVKIEDNTENNIEETVETEKAASQKYYLLCKSYNSNNGNQIVDEISFEFDKREAIVPNYFPGDFVHPEISYVLPQYSTICKFYPNHLFSKIDKYIFTNTNYGDYEEEALEFDSEGKLIHIKLNMENSDYNVEESNDETYKIGYSDGVGIHFTYDNNGLLIKESMTGRGEEDINYICFDYDEKGRIVKAYGSIEFVEINDTYKYDENNKKGYKYSSGSSEVSLTYYYDERGLCYKVENENGEIENLYGYVEVTVNDDGTITKGEEFDGELQNFKESTLSAEQALEAVKNFCYSTDPDLKQIEESGKYPVYWQMDDEIKNQQCKVLFCSYTRVKVNYYVNMIDGNAMETLEGESSETSTGITFNAWDYLNKDVSMNSIVSDDSEIISDSEKTEILDFLQGEWRTFGMGLYGRGYFKMIFTENTLQYWVDDADGNYTFDHEVRITALSIVDGKYRVTTDNMYYESDDDGNLIYWFGDGNISQSDSLCRFE